MIFNTEDEMRNKEGWSQPHNSCDLVSLQGKFETHTLQGTNISPKKLHFEDDFPFPNVGYVNSLEGITNFFI